MICWFLLFNTAVSQRMEWIDKKRQKSTDKSGGYIESINAFIHSKYSKRISSLVINQSLEVRERTYWGKGLLIMKWLKEIELQGKTMNQGSKLRKKKIVCINGITIYNQCVFIPITSIDLLWVSRMFRLCVSLIWLLCYPW